MEQACGFSPGEVQDVRNRNRGLKIGILVLIVLLLLAGAAAAVYFFVFADNRVQLEYEPLPDKNSLIYLNQTDPATGEEWAKKIDKFIERRSKSQFAQAGRTIV